MRHCAYKNIVAKTLLVCGFLVVFSALCHGADYTIHVVEPAVTNHLILQDKPLPPVCKKTTAIELFACRGEYEPASFVVTASKPLAEVMIEVGPVSGPGQQWPEEAVDVRVVKDVYRGVLGVSGLIPLLLVHDESFLVARSAPTVANPDGLKTNEAGFLVDSGPPASGFTLNGELRDTSELLPVKIAKRKQFWITVHVPDHAYPGTYETTLRVVPQNAGPTELTLQIHVYPFALQPPMIEYSIYYPVKLVPEGSEDWRTGRWTNTAWITPEQYVLECENMLAHGLSNPNIYTGVIKKADETLDFSILEEVLALREKAGMGPGLPLYAMNGAAGPVARALTDQEKADHIRMVREVMAWGKHRGYPDIYWAAEDEAWGDWLASERDSLQAIKDGGGKVFVACSNDFLDLVGDRLQCPVLISSMPGYLKAVAAKYPPDQVLEHTAEIARHAGVDVMAKSAIYRKNIDSTHRAGNKIFTYMNPPAGVPLPELQRRSEGLGLWRVGFDGTMTWAYTHIKDEPLNQNMGWAKVMRVQGGVLDTLHWEGHREGVDDVRYLTTLLDAIARARGRFPGNPLIRQTEDWLDNIDVVDGNLDDIRREMARRTVALLDLGYRTLTTEQALATIDADQVQIIAFPELWRFKLVPVPEATMIGANALDADQGTREKWFDPGTDDSQWSPLQVGGGYTREAGGGWGNDPGFGWYRTELPLTAQGAKKKFKYLYFEACDEDTWGYLNGQQFFEHSFETTGLMPSVIWQVPFVAPLNDVKLHGNDLLVVRVRNSTDMGGIWKPVHLILSDQELNDQQVKALVTQKTTPE
jgi:hypothetical protein